MDMPFSEHQAGENMKSDTFHHEPIHWITGGSYTLQKFVTIKLNKTSPT